MGATRCPAIGESFVVQLRLLEIDLEPHDRESLEGAGDVLAKDERGGVPEDNIIKIG